MPTPVPAARQCLTPEAVASLEDAVAVARRRGHGQTTSLHMVSALLSLPNSLLREACARARSNNVAYPARVQFKALDLSLTVSLDRLPSNSQNRGDNEPPVSNSLMAAIKRSQANQRRQPEHYTFYQQKQQQQQQYASACSSIPVVKVELQNLIISILDDPLVSRVFGEAGFRNFDIKMAVLRKGNNGFHYPSQVFGCTSRYNYRRSNPPLFLCNFPFMGCFAGGDESSRRIADIMRREKKRCPLLLGVSAVDALGVFLEKLSKGVVLADGLCGIEVVCVKDEIFRCLNDDFDDGPLRSKFEEVENMMENCSEAKVVVNFGDLKEFGGDGINFESLRFLMKKLSNLVMVYSKKLWLIGAAASYEVYFKILNMFPTIGQDWDLEILPITSLKFSVGGSYPRSSLMESFVPLGGFFSTPPETKNPTSSNSCQNTSRCHLCNEKYEQEVAALSNVELRASVTEKFQSTLPSWLHSPAQTGSNSSSSSIKGKDDSMLLTAKITCLRRKWDGICQQHHLSETFLKGYQFPRLHGSQVARDGKQENGSNNGSNNSKDSSNNQENKNVSDNSSDVSKAKNLSILSKSRENQSESPTAVTSVTTDLGLGMKSPSRWSSRLYDVRDPKSIYKALVESVSRQEEAISIIVDTITKSRRNVWINIRGPDRLGKRKLGLAIAETLYGNKESLVYADLSFQNEMTRAETIFDCHMANKYEPTMRGTIIDYFVEKLSKNPSVVFLENIDRADLVIQNSLSQAVRTGRLSDLHGREVNISNCMFIGTINSGEKSRKYTEEDVLRAKGGSIQMMIRFDLNDDPMDEKLFSTNKRKLDRTDQCERVYKKASKSYLDLNLPVSSEESDSENSRSSWVEDFDGLIDRTVDFEPFDFDGLGERVLEEINLCLRNVVGSGYYVEIEPVVMLQILAGAYSFGETRVEDWVRSVVSGAFLEATEKFGLNDRSIVKISRCECVDSDELLLPDRIIIK